MKSFEFSLERVLRWRCVQLASEEAKLRRLVEDQVRMQQQIHSLRSEKLKTESTATGLSSLHGLDLTMLHGYRLHTANEERRILEALNRKEQEIAVQQRCYREAKQRFRLLEELRKRKFTAWQQEWDKELDEMAAESFNAALARNRAGAGE